MGNVEQQNKLRGVHEHKKSTAATWEKALQRKRGEAASDCQFFVVRHHQCESLKHQWPEQEEP